MTHRTKHPRKTAPLRILIILVLTLGVLDLALMNGWLNLLDLSPEKLPSGSGDAVLSDTLAQLAQEDSAYQPLADHPEDYPSELLDLAARNREALDFVLAYPEEHGTPPAGTIGDLKEGEIPHLLQWDRRWGYTIYGDHTLAVSGCGPTCLSMVAASLTGDDTITPAKVAQWSSKHGHYVSGAGTSWSLMTEGAAHFGLTAQELPLDEARMKEELEQGRPIILSVREGDFTTSGHFIVLTAAEDGAFRVQDPNSPSLSLQLWDYETLAPQIRNLWSFSLAE